MTTTTTEMPAAAPVQIGRLRTGSQAHRLGSQLTPGQEYSYHELIGLFGEPYNRQTQTRVSLAIRRLERYGLRRLGPSHYLWDPNSKPQAAASHWETVGTEGTLVVLRSPDGKLYLARPLLPAGD
jgi:hypothetical protein